MIKFFKIKLFLILYFCINNKIYSQEFSYIGDALEAFNPCQNGVLFMERIVGGPPDKENYWDGSLNLGKYPSLPEARIEIKFDAPANVTVDPNEARINVREDNTFWIGYFKPEYGYKRAKFKVFGEPRGKFPNVEKLQLNGVDICPNSSKWEPTILGLSAGGSTINTNQIQRVTEVTLVTPPRLPHSNCGRRLVKHEGLILNGYPSKEGDWPWHAAIYHLNIDYEYKCGGTLITSNVVLTASHCVVENDRFLISHRLKVKLGLYNRLVAGKNVQEFLVFRIIPHAEYDFDTLKNDIALLKLSTEPTLSQYIQPICLWHKDLLNKLDDTNNIIEDATKGFVVGWGFNNERKLSNILSQAQMPIVTLTDCLESNREFFAAYLSDKNFCAGFRNGTSVCNGDSGGGMFFKNVNGQYFIRGLVSLSVLKNVENQAICDSQEYVLFTDISKYLDWIDLNLL